MVPTVAYVAVSAVLFTIGVVGVLVRRNALVIFMSIELMLNAVNVSLASFARQHNQASGQVFVLLILAVAAAEVAVGLAIIISIHRHRDSVDVDNVNLMKW